LSEPPQTRQRLDSWKAIAEYLQRDVATVARWEKGLGLPVRRVAGTGRSVFAYTSEIDEWLRTNRPNGDSDAPLPPSTEASAAPASPASKPSRAAFGLWSWLGLSAAVLALVAALWIRPRTTAAEDLRVELTDTGVVARDSLGKETWRHSFPGNGTTYLPLASPGRTQIVAAAPAGVYFATGYRANPQGNEIRGGELTFLNSRGQGQRSFAFDDRVTVNGAPYEGPWAMTAFAVNEANGTRRVAVSAHHYTWDPGLVTILDDRWQRHGTFVHAGWVEQLRWITPERLLIGGFSNARDGGMIALLDPGALDGQGPEMAGSRHYCDSCGSDRPLRMFVFPRTEINLASGARFNRVLLDGVGDRVIARTVEMTMSDGDAVAVYEFTPSLDLVSARFGERYWDMHRTLESEGRLTHSREQCPDREGPRQFLEWTPATGWRTLPTR
jgi:hypothetical protein